MSKRLASFAALALALVAVSLLVLQPICEAGELRQPQPASYATATGEDSGGSCCSIVAVAPLRAATPAAQGLSVALPEATIDSSAFRPEMLISGTVASAAPLPVPRYHARSARIQR